MSGRREKEKRDGEGLIIKIMEDNGRVHWEFNKKEVVVAEVISILRAMLDDMEIQRVLNVFKAQMQQEMMAQARMKSEANKIIGIKQ